MAVLSQPERLQDEKFRAFTPDWQRYELQTDPRLRGLGNEERGRWAEQLASIRAAHERGVTLLAGTDLSGVSLQWELEYLVQAGLSPLDVLRIATEHAAAAVGAENDLGSIAPGKLADIVLLDKNPLEDIRNTQRIWRVIKGGWVFDPDTLRPPATSSTPDQR